VEKIISNKKKGVVYILDALGASNYSDQQIESFLLTRKELGSLIEKLSSQINELSPDYSLEKPSVYTFGDTVILAFTYEDEKHLEAHILSTAIMMQNFILLSLQKGILFRGAFSVGSYIESPESNTVMGEAVSDAAAWYEKADWMGIISTPKANNVIEFIFSSERLTPNYLWKYDVPLKDSSSVSLYTIPWPSKLVTDPMTAALNPFKCFLSLIKDLPVPIGTESKFKNTIEYFKATQSEIDKLKQIT